MRIIEKYAIAKIVEKRPKAKREGFTKDLKKFLIEYNKDEATNPENDQALSPQFIPDLFEIDSNSITVWEIENTSFIDDKKLTKISAWWFSMNCAFQSVKITFIVTDRYGYNWREIDLFTAYDVVSENERYER